MRKLLIYIIHIVFLSLIQFISAAYIFAGETPITLSANQQKYYLTNHFSAIKDLQKNITIEQILSGQLDDQFELIDRPWPNFGFTRATIWIRFSIYNPTSSQAELIIDLNYAPIEQLDFFVKMETGEVVKTSTGSALPYDTRPIKQGTFAFPVTIKANSQQTYYFRLSGHDPLPIYLTIYDKLQYDDVSYRRDMINGVVYGILISMSIYNFFLFNVFRDSAYLYFVLFTVSTMLLHMSIYGSGYQFWPNSPQFNVLLRPISGTLGISSLIMFWRSFFHSKEHIPKLDIVLLLVVGLMVITFFIVIIFGNSMINRIVPIALLSTTILLIIMYRIRRKQGYHPPKYFISAWLVLYTSIFIFPLIGLKLIPPGEWARWALQIGTSFEAMLLSFALSDRINRIRQEQYQSEQKLRDAEILAKTRSEFLAKMSHEIRTPMNGVLGMAELLKLSTLPKLQKYYADIIYRSGKTLLDIINDILDYSKIDAGKMELESIQFKLEEIIKDSLSAIYVEAVKKKIEVIEDVDENIPNYLYGDPLRFRQILINLLSNALKFTSSGQIILTVNVENNNKIENKVLLRISVKDTGIGIDKKNQKKLFEAFSQTDETISRRYGGTGLGLAITKQLVDLMHGEVGVISQAGKGSEFWLMLSFPYKEEIHEIADQAVLKNCRLMTISQAYGFNEIFKRHAIKWNVEFHAYDFDDLSQIEDTFGQYDFVVMDLCNMNHVDHRMIKKFEKSIRAKNTFFLFFIDSFVMSDDFLFNYLENKNTLSKPINFKQLRNYLIRAKRGEKPDDFVHDVAPKLITFEAMNVLVAEDNKINQIVIQSLLNKVNVKGNIFSNGKDALHELKINHAKYDLILMDCEMPEMNGFDATKYIRSYEAEKKLNEIPIVALTAHVLNEYRDKCMQAGMNDYLSKPIEFDDLIDILQKYQQK